MENQHHVEALALLDEYLNGVDGKKEVDEDVQELGIPPLKTVDVLLKQKRVQLLEQDKKDDKFWKNGDIPLLRFSLLLFFLILQGACVVIFVLAGSLHGLADIYDHAYHDIEDYVGHQKDKETKEQDMKQALLFEDFSADDSPIVQSRYLEHCNH